MHPLRHQEIDRHEVHEDDEAEVVIDEEAQVLQEDVDHDEVADKNEFVLNSIRKSLVSVE